MRLILWIIGFIIAASVTAFAVFNRHSVDLFWSPVNEPVSLPLYAVGLGFMVYGFLVGAAIVWLSGSAVRRSRRKQIKRIRELEKELHTDEALLRTGPPPADFFPALPMGRKASK